MTRTKFLSASREINYSNTVVLRRENIAFIVTSVDFSKTVFTVSEHENVKAFISHTGILSTIEAIDAGIPVVAIPLFGDQYGNAAVLQDAGVASIVSYQDLKKAYLLDAINEVLDPT